MNGFWIDTHAHLYADDFKADRNDVVGRCIDQHIDQIYMPNIDRTSIDDMLELENRYPRRMVPMMGLHPCSVKRDFEKELYIVEEWLFKRRFIAVGEMGTDLYWDKSFWEQQQEAFKIQVRWAVQLKLPIVIHCRESMAETLDLLEPMVSEDLTGVFHCFTGTVEQARRIATMGFYVGLGGVATFKNGGMDTVIPHLDADNIVLETDSPYLAPVPHRGKRNEPSYIPLIAERVSSLKKISAEELREITTRNALRLFKKSIPLHV